MRFACALLGVALLAVPAAAQPFMVPLQQQHQSEAPPPPSPAPVAPPQSGNQTNGPSRADAQDKAQAGDATNSTEASGGQRNDDSRTAGQ